MDQLSFVTVKPKVALKLFAAISIHHIILVKHKVVEYHNGLSSALHHRRVLHFVDIETRFRIELTEVGNELRNVGDAKKGAQGMVLYETYFTRLLTQVRGA